MGLEGHWGGGGLGLSIEPPVALPIQGEEGGGGTSWAESQTGTFGSWASYRARSLYDFGSQVEAEWSSVQVEQRLLRLSPGSREKGKGERKKSEHLRSSSFQGPLTNHLASGIKGSGKWILGKLQSTGPGVC